YPTKGRITKIVAHNDATGPTADLYTYLRDTTLDGGSYTEQAARNLLDNLNADYGPYANSSLYLEPVTQKAGTVYSQKPLDRTGDFTLTRAGDTGTFTNEDGLIETALANVPRYTWKDGKVSLLLEPARTNYSKWSSDMSNITTSGTTVTGQQQLAPNGLNEGAHFIEDTSNSTHGTSNGTADLINGQVYSITIWFKGDGSGRNLRLKMGSAVGAGVLIIDSSTGAILVDTAIDNAVVVNDNGWWKITCNVTGLSSSGSVYVNPGIADGTTETYLGDGVSGIYIWGCQVEQGTYPTTYIKTEAATVNRGIDTMSLSGLQTNGILGATEGTVFYSFKDTDYSSDSLNRLLGIYETGETTNSIFLSNQADNDTVAFRIFVGGIPITVNTLVPYTNSKIAIKYNLTSIKIYINGVPEVDQAFTGLAYTDFKTDIRRTFNLAELHLYPTALTDQELIDLTT
ncbi:MAG: hypothetical protein DRI65_16465, partial [Chloroflexota bacterium]